MLASHEVACHLGKLALLGGDPPLAQERFAKAVAANPANSRAWAGLGDAYKFQKKWEEARPFYERSLALDSKQPENQLDWAEYLHERALVSQEARERRHLLRAARRAYAKSFRLDPSIPETYAMYGSTFLVEGEDPARGIETLEHAHALLRSNLAIKLLLARAYVGVGRLGEARDLLAVILAWSHDDDQLDQARALLDQIDEPAAS